MQQSHSHSGPCAPTRLHALTLAGLIGLPGSATSCGRATARPAAVAVSVDTLLPHRPPSLPPSAERKTGHGTQSDMQQETRHAGQGCASKSLPFREQQRAWGAGWYGGALRDPSSVGHHMHRRAHRACYGWRWLGAYGRRQGRWSHVGWCRARCQHGRSPLCGCLVGGAGGWRDDCASRTRLCAGMESLVVAARAAKEGAAL